MDSICEFVYMPEAPALASTYKAKQKESGKGLLDSHDRDQRRIEYLRQESPDRVDAQPFEIRSHALLWALIAVFDLNGVTPTVRRGFTPYLVK